MFCAKCGKEIISGYRCAECGNINQQKDRITVIINIIIGASIPTAVLGLVNPIIAYLLVRKQWRYNLMNFVRD
jgi:DNA-directed RNA polymerase subunit RPC12/RpoP